MFTLTLLLLLAETVEHIVGLAVYTNVLLLLQVLLDFYVVRKLRNEREIGMEPKGQLRIIG